MVELDEISNKIAKDIGVDELLVRQINRSQWKLLVDTIRSGTFDPVNMIYLGKFIKNKRDVKIREAIRRNRERMV